jgi:hypothetical protein
MKHLIAVLLGTAFLIGTVSATSNTDYSHWSTAALQQKRVELYKQLPVRGNRKNIAIYVKEGEPLPQEDEIRLIERELNARKTHGDKAAYFEPAAPSIYRHKNPSG